MLTSHPPKFSHRKFLNEQPHISGVPKGFIGGFEMVSSGEGLGQRLATYGLLMTIQGVNFFTRQTKDALQLYWEEKRPQEDQELVTELLSLVALLFDLATIEPATIYVKNKAARMLVYLLQYVAHCGSC
jgi:hypothetical protein